MARNEFSDEQLRELSEVFRGLGATRPESWAASELGEGIPQLAYFLFFKQAWSLIEDERDTQWIDTYIEWGGPLGLALKRMRSSGVSDSDIATVVQTMQYDLLGGLCSQLDDCTSSPVNLLVPDGWPLPRWKLFLVDDDCKPLRKLSCLHEFADSGDSTGREDGYR